MPSLHLGLPAVLCLPVSSCVPAAVLFLFLAVSMQILLAFFAPNFFGARQYFICLRALGNDGSHDLFGSVHASV